MFFNPEVIATWHAIDALEALINESVDENGKAASISLNEDYSKKGEYHLTRIGCIGDSITEGTSAWNNDFTYPAQLGRFLWKDALVYNFGKSGATLRKDFEWNYFISSNYQSALEKANEIDLFFIMIGTNDSKQQIETGKGAWDDEADRLYIDDCKYLMGTLKEKNSNVRFVLSTVTACYNPAFSWGYGNERVCNLPQAMIPELNDSGFPTVLFDMYSVTAALENNYTDYYIEDGLHPSAKGYLYMAEPLAEFLEEYIHSLG